MELYPLIVPLAMPGLIGSKPAIVLLHGFPTSSYQFHDLSVWRIGFMSLPDYPAMAVLMSFAEASPWALE